MNQTYRINKETVRRVLIVFGALIALVVSKILFYPDWGMQGPIAQIVTLVAVAFGVSWVLNGLSKNRDAARGDFDLARVLAVLGVRRRPQSGNPDDALSSVVHESPRAVVIDWRGMPSEIVGDLAKAAAPLGCQVKDIGEEGEKGWARFVFIRGSEEVRLRARHNADDDFNDLVVGFAKLAPELEILLYVPFMQADTWIYLVLSKAEAAELRIAAGEHYRRWFAPPPPLRAALIVPA